MAKGALFHPFRALGYVTAGVPFAVQRRGRNTFLTVSAGKAWQIYNCAKLTLIFVGQPLERSITALASKNDFTFAAYGPHVAVFRRAHRIGTWRGTGGDVIALLPLGDLVLALSVDGMLTPWSPSDFAAPAHAPVALPSGFVPTCVCHPDAYVNKALVGGADGRLALVNFVSGRVVHTFAGFGAAVRCLAASPALDVVAAGLADGRVLLHNVRVDATVAAFVHDAAGGAVTAAAFRTGPGPPVLACGGASGAVTAWDLAGKRLQTVLKEAHDGPVLSLHFFTGEPVLMSSGGDNAVKQWIFDAEDGGARLLRFRSGHAAPPVVLRYYGEGRRLLSAGADRAFRVFSTVQDQQSRELSQRNVAHRAKKLRVAEEELKLPPVTAVAANQLRERDWCNVVTAHAGAPAAYTWRLADGALGEHVLTPPRAAGAAVTAVAISACGHYALLGAASGDVDRFNLQSGLHRGGFVRRPGDDEVAAAAAAEAATANATAATMREPDADGAGSSDEDADGDLDAADAAAAPAKRKQAALVRPGKPPSLWALAGPRRERDDGAAAHGGAVTVVETDACNGRVLSAGLDGMLRQWGFRSRRLAGAAAVGAAVERGCLHRGAALLALSCVDRRARVFDVAAPTPRRVRAFPAHGDAVTDLAFSADARWLLSACLDGALRVWDVPAGRLLQALRLGGAPITALALSPDMDLLATAHAGKRGIYLWANRLVFSAGGEAELAPPPAEGAPPLDVRAPAVGEAQARAGRGGWGSRGDGDDSDDDGCGAASDGDGDGEAPAGVGTLVEADGEEGGGDCAAAAPTLPTLPPLPQVAPRMATLALLPRAQWMALLHLDTLRERGKPTAPPKKPEAAPFFLPTLATLAPHPVFDTAAAADAAAARPASRVLRGGGGGGAAARSPLLRAVAAGAASSPPDYSAAVDYLAACGPSALDAELRSLTLSSPDASSLAEEDAAALAALLDFFRAALASGRAFELLHAALAATLRVHAEALAARPELRERAAALRDAAGAAWARLDRRFQHARCVLGFLAGLGQA